MTAHNLPAPGRPLPPLVSWRTLRVGSVSVRVYPRVLGVAAVLVAVVGVVAALTLGISQLDLSPAETWWALWGTGDAASVRSVQGRRLPRLLTALCVGGALGVSGSVFQSLSRNVLGSPDIIGFTTGAATAATFQMVVFGGGVVPTAVAALVGGLVTALIVYTLARRDGVTGGLRLVLVGVGAGAILSAVTDFLIAKADISDAATVQLWTSGSLVGRGWTHVGVIAAALALVLIPLIVASRALAIIEMGDDAATSVGTATERTRFAMVVLAVVLVGVATAAAGPIAFVALAAPQIARRLLRSGRIALGVTFLVGGTLLAAADLLAQSLDIGLRTPVGLVTSLLGGVYLLWLLARRV